jgi:glycosyltransferase involved in cell wall biosynthesis
LPRPADGDIAAMTDLPKYALVTPMRDEAQHLQRTIESIVAQRHRPTRWIIVDDGSTDGSGEIAARFAQRHPWIRLVTSEASHDRARGAPIVHAFRRGMAEVREAHEFIVKLDADLFVPPHYFEWVARVFADDPRAGIVGGSVLIFDGTRWRADRGHGRAVNGVAKAYRVACLRDIGGLQASMGWDGIDDYAARARGWHTRVLTELTLLHYKPRGSKQRWYRARWEEGRGAHFMGYGWGFLLLRATYRMLRERPAVLGGVVLASGYGWARMRKLPQADDPLARRRLRAEQRARLLAWAGVRAPSVPTQPETGPAFTATARDPIL